MSKRNQRRHRTPKANISRMDEWERCVRTARAAERDCHWLPAAMFWKQALDAITAVTRGEAATIRKRIDDCIYKHNRDEALALIAAGHLQIDTFRVRNANSLDTYVADVGAIYAALCDAYDAGRGKTDLY